MKIATLQFGPKIGDVEGNIRCADKILKKREDDLKGLDLLVLPEMAFTGYNFPSSEAITPFMEPSQAGPSTEWAQSTSKRLNCIVCVGYPESFKAPQHSQTQSEDVDNERYYNSVIATNRCGSPLFNYRKRFLYYTDETWATEGDIEWGGISLPIDTRPESSSSSSISTSMGVCMDINPYQFKAPYTDYEFASRVLQSGSRLVVLPMSWLTYMSKSELEGQSSAPDMDTFNYWIQRFWPLISGKGKVGSSRDDEDRETVIVFANRIGEELGDDSKGHSTARYAGSSTIITIRRRGSAPSSAGEDDLSGTDILLWDILGRGEEGICVADTSKEPKSVFKIRRRRPTAGSESSDDD